MRQRKNLPVDAIVHVYRMTRAIPSLFVYADARQWDGLGGMQKLMKRNVCGVNYNKNDPKVQAAARNLGCPLEEYARAKEIQQYRVVRGIRGERVNGWVRVNSASFVGDELTLTKGFELMLSCSDHEQFMEHVKTFRVVDAADEFGVVTTQVDLDDGGIWSTSAHSPSPFPKGGGRERVEDEDDYESVAKKLF
jgi:hypothetical protein